MALTLQEQFRVGTNAITSGDMELLQKILLDPDTVTRKEQRTAAQKLGVKGGLLTTFVDLISDPTVWIAALMSRTFPTAAWLRGTVPNRMIGQAAEFSGISYVTRPIESFFRGTAVPRLNALALRRHAEVMKAGQGMFKHLSRPNWREEMPTVSLILEGQSPTGATQELRSVARDIRGTMDEMWGFLGRTQKIQGGFGDAQITRATAGAFHSPNVPRYLRDFLPHMPLTGAESIIEINGKDALRRMGRGKFRQALELRGVKPEDVWSATAVDSLASNFTRYQAFMGSVGHQINPRLFVRKRFGIPLESDLGRELFVTDLNTVLPQYVESVARTYSINAPISNFERTLLATPGRTVTNEPVIVQIINEGLDASGARFSRSPIKGTPHFRDVMLPGSTNAPMMSALQRLVRAVKGSSGDDEILFGNMFSTIGARVDSMRSALTGKQITQVDAALKSFERTASYRQRSNGITSFFYASTLGLNPFSAVQNLLQPILTTAPAIGIGSTLAGYRTLRSRLGQYATEVATQHRLLRGNKSVGATFRVNEAVQRAFVKTFPEIAEQGIKIDPRLFDIDEALLTVPRGMFGTRFFKDRDQFYKALLQPFTHTEMSNQIVTFFGAKQAMRRAVRDGTYVIPRGLSKTGIEELLNFDAGLIVNATQFRPGPGTRSVVQGILPSFMRQFTSFPTRLFNFFTESTVRGAMTNAQLEQARVLNLFAGGAKGRAAAQKLLGGGRNLGTISRSFLFGKIATTGARNAFGVDLGSSLGITGPFNVAPEGQPFAPLPLPPAPSMVYGVMSAASNRDMKPLQPLHLPFVGAIPWPRTLFPGGVAASRAARAFNQFRPDAGGFVDDNERLMYRGDTTDLVLSMLGIPLEDNRRTRQAVERMQANRMRIRQFRRSYATAATTLDTGEMTRLSSLYRERFPDMPALAVSGKDLRRYRHNAKIPMVQRLLETTSRASRPFVFDFEVDSDLLAPPEIPASFVTGLN